MLFGFSSVASVSICEDREVSAINDTCVSRCTRRRNTWLRSGDNAFLASDVFGESKCFSFESFNAWFKDLMS
jgi:hypothetical protein